MVNKTVLTPNRPTPMSKIMCFEDYVKWLRKHDGKKVHISEKTADHLAAVGLRDLRLTLAKCTQVAERYFKIFKKKKVRMYKEVRDVGIQLWFHRKKGLEKIRARFAPLLE